MSYNSAISIHALREEGDVDGDSRTAQILRFLSTPSARRATSGVLIQCCCIIISIHALREEGDIRHRKCSPLPVHFYPRPPRGGRPSGRSLPPILSGISIHALREEGDRSYMMASSTHEIFLSTPSARRATTNLAAFADREIFLSTPSARRATGGSGTGHSQGDDFYPRPPRGGRHMVKHNVPNCA